jgi:hypothetical protein
MAHVLRTGLVGKMFGIGKKPAAAAAGGAAGADLAAKIARPAAAAPGATVLTGLLAKKVAA